MEDLACVAHFVQKSSSHFRSPTVSRIRLPPSDMSSIVEHSKEPQELILVSYVLCSPVSLGALSKFISYCMTIRHFLSAYSSDAVVILSMENLAVSRISRMREYCFGSSRFLVVVAHLHLSVERSFFFCVSMESLRVAWYQLLTRIIVLDCKLIVILHVSSPQNSTGRWI